MVWGAISHRGVVNLVEIEGNKESQYFCNILGDTLVSQNENILDENWILQQEETALHTSYYT